MYRLLKNNNEVCVAEQMHYIKKQDNDCYIVCKYDEHEGVNADGRIYLKDEYDSISSFNAVNELFSISAMAREQTKIACEVSNTPPVATIGRLHYGADKWEPSKEYAKYDLFEYNGAIGWVKQAHTSQETWLPFSAGTEALYGARPEPDAFGVYPYVYNMAAEVGMLVREGFDVYECIQATSDLLYAPSQVPALFKVKE